MKILIIGAGGFVGSNLVKSAKDRNFEVWASIRPTTDLSLHPKSDVHYVSLDFSNKETLFESMRLLIAQSGGWDYIIHNLGVTKTSQTISFYRINHLYLEWVVEALEHWKTIPKLFLYMSSFAAVGAGDEETMAPRLLTDPATPDSAYGRSKRRAEEFLFSKPDFPYVILRPTGIYGPADRDYLSMIELIRDNLSVVPGVQRQQFISFIYIDDLVHLILLLYTRMPIRKIFFATDGRSYPAEYFNELAAKELQKRCSPIYHLPLWLVTVICVLAEDIAKLFGKTSTLNRDKLLTLKRRNWTCDSSSLEKELGFKAEVTLEEGVRRTIKWYKQQKWI